MLELALKRNLEDKCEIAGMVVMKCASGCGFVFSAANVGIFKSRDGHQEICVDNQGEFFSQAATHFHDYLGIGSVQDTKNGLWKTLPDNSHNIFNLTATNNGLSFQLKNIELHI